MVMTITVTIITIMRKAMKFYNRENELKILNDVEQSSKDCSKMTFIVGRRRIGKTALIKEGYKNKNFIYFFISKKNEKLLCEEFVKNLSQAGIKVYGSFTKFSEIFSFLMNYAETEKITLVIDEFQEFQKINSSIYSDIQNIWDQHKKHSKMNLVLSGSIYSLMKKIFENNKEPLFGRADKKINLSPFDINTIKEIYLDICPEYNSEDFLAFYIITGGIAKYIELFYNNKLYSLNKILDFFFSSNSILLDEGKNLLIEEFGKDYATYFSILALIADSKTSRTEIESILEKNIGGYLDRLENEYSIIKKIKPIFSRPGGRTQKYIINDNFLSFWFRYVYKYKSAVEIENFNSLKQFIKKDFKTFSGKFLEKYFIEKLKLSGEFTNIGNYWEKGNQNEIDIVAVNEFDKKALFAEVKLNKEKINLNKLKAKSEKLLKKLNGYSIEYKAFSLNDM